MTTINIDDKITDEQIKQLIEKIRKLPNGEYTISICPICESYFCRPDGDIKKAKITICAVCLLDAYSRSVKKEIP